jgi:hypothetical protein
MLPSQVPVLQTLHNYRLFCAGAFFFRDGRVCEDCLGKFFPWPGVVHRCYRGSRMGSAVLATMQSVHHARGTWRGCNCNQIIGYLWTLFPDWVIIVG